MSTSKVQNKRYVNNDARIDGKIVIITGANSGLGLETAKQLAKRGGKIYLACRSEKKGLEAVKQVKQFSQSENINFLQLDLASLDNVRAFAKKFHELENCLDILVNNAGLGVPKLERTVDGNEMNMGVNHFAHFLLTNLLLDMLKKSTQGRIVILGSFTHSFGKIQKDNLNCEKNFPKQIGPTRSWSVYANSKLANMLFCHELAKRLGKDSKITVNCCCPGMVATEICQNLFFIEKMFMYVAMKLFYRDVNFGAQTQIMLAVEPDLEKVTGKYYVDCKEKEPEAHAKDDEISKWLWEESEKVVGLKL